jgi:hypothetical protein
MAAATTPSLAAATSIQQQIQGHRSKHSRTQKQTQDCTTNTLLHTQRCVASVQVYNFTALLTFQWFSSCSQTMSNITINTQHQSGGDAANQAQPSRSTPPRTCLALHQAVGERALLTRGASCSPCAPGTTPGDLQGACSRACGDTAAPRPRATAAAQPPSAPTAPRHPSTALSPCQQPRKDRKHWVLMA